MKIVWRRSRPGDAERAMADEAIAAASAPKPPPRSAWQVEEVIDALADLLEEMDPDGTELYPDRHALFNAIEDRFAAEPRRPRPGPPAHSETVVRNVMDRALTAWNEKIRDEELVSHVASRSSHPPAPAPVLDPYATAFEILRRIPR